MTNYTIVRIGNEYIVQVDDKSVLKISSRRKAVKLVTDAAELLDQETTVQQVDDSPSISRASDAGPDMPEVS
ncbi:hypothetical protein [Bradyrhizobium lablabi]|uniref:hypothetical protein n=1 Tax=Bradyrhizobium lablabi TaxID=722472 RepID=UPI001BA89B97|nr:hypothetical protein [Bradyrhizobium lablabi]MBR0694128.1 hypothetical protein [Bradyrhizobium lablabi]